MLRWYKKHQVWLVLTTIVFLNLTTLPGVAQESATDEETLRAGIKTAMATLDARGKETKVPYAVFRRGAPVDRAAWNAMDDLYRAVGRVAEAAQATRVMVDRLRHRWVRTQGRRRRIPSEARDRGRADRGIVGTVGRQLDHRIA